MPDSAPGTYPAPPRGPHTTAYQGALADKFGLPYATVIALAGNLQHKITAAMLAPPGNAHPTTPDTEAGVAAMAEDIAALKGMRAAAVAVLLATRPERPTVTVDPLAGVHIGRMSAVIARDADEA